MFKKVFVSSIVVVSISGFLFAQEGRGGRGQVTLPDGPGKQAVQSACVQCHALGLIANGHSREDWQTVIAMMVNDGAKVPPDQMGELTDYLTKNFPERPAPPAKILPGPVKVTFKEWTVPTPGSRPHDPLAARDGTIWFSGHMGGLLGRIDPKTGEIKEFRPKTANAGPHGLVEDKDGNIWFTENFKGAIGELFPKTGEFKEYKLPAEARDPHTPLFDQKGILWFTVQGANLVGRLDPKTGDIKVVSSPTQRSNPYGMVVTSKGIPIYCEFGSNKIASVEPNTMAIHEWTLPNPESRPRRIAIDNNDNIWYADYSRGYLGKLETATGKVTEWPSPSGPQSQPYGIVWLKGAVWYSESAVKPNTLARFDPKTEQFQTWAIPSGGGVVRNMMVTRDGNIAMAESGVNKVGLAIVAK